MSGLTRIGYEDLIDRIVNRTLDPPRGITASGMTQWLNGYATCQHDIIDLIQSLMIDQKE